MQLFVFEIQVLDNLNSVEFKFYSYVDVSILSSEAVEYWVREKAVSTQSENTIITWMTKFVLYIQILYETWLFYIPDIN